MSRRRIAAAATAVIAATIMLLPATSPVAASGGSSLPPVSADVVVQLDAASGTTIDQLNAAHGTVTVDSIFGSAGTFLVAAPDGRTQAALAAELAVAPGVLFAEPNVAVGSPEVTGLPTRVLWSFSSPAQATAQYAQSLLQLDAAHGLATGAGVTVAVIDTGVQLKPAAHPALAGSLLPGIDFVDGDDVPDDARNGIDTSGNGIPDEEAGHGTHVAGIVHMVAPAAKILPVRALDPDGVGTMFTIAKAMEWAVDHGANVLSMSLGAHSSANVIKNVVASVQARGVVVVAAAGNDGKNTTNYPAGAKCAVAVASSGATDTVSSFSTVGTFVSVSAPGEDITSTFPYTTSGYASWSGTSMATPFVSGQAALLRSIAPTLTGGEVLAYIAGTTTPLAGGPAPAGSGRINIVASLQAAAAGQLPSAVTAGIDKNCLK
jgi:thermitase